jgi:signal peptidase I
MSEQSIREKKLAQLKLRPRNDLLNVLGGRPAKSDVSIKGANSSSSIIIPNRKGSPFKSLLIVLTVLLIILICIKTFIYQPYLVPSTSMLPSIRTGDILIVNKLHLGVGNPLWGASETKQFLSIIKNPFYGKSVPGSRTRYILRLPNYLQRGMIIVFKYPTNKFEMPRDHVKRVIALSGDRVMIKKGYVFVNGRKQHENYKIIRDDYSMAEVRIPLGYCFVLGDNRPKSQDSRTFGPLQEDRVIGVVNVRAWPKSRAGTIR